MRAQIKVPFLALIIAFMSSDVYPQNQTPVKGLKNVIEKTIHSNILNEDRVVYIYSPEGDANAKYPVIYMLDGKRSKTYSDMIEYSKTNPHIIVGIANNGNRSRDMYPVKINSRPGSGGANQFLNFISIELKPFIEKNYNTGGKNILFGASASGFFTIYAMLTKPNAFSDYISLSPTIGNCNDFMTEKINQLFPKSILNDKSLYILYGLKHEMSVVTQFVPDFKNKLVKKFEQLRVYCKGLENSGHVPSEGFQGGLKFIYNE